MSPSRPVRVAIVNDYEVVVRGLSSMLAPFRDRVAVVELDAVSVCCVTPQAASATTPAAPPTSWRARRRATIVPRSRPTSSRCCTT